LSDRRHVWKLASDFDAGEEVVFPAEKPRDLKEVGDLSAGRLDLAIDGFGENEKMSSSVAS
jgi:hypothetical protein